MKKAKQQEVRELSEKEKIFFAECEIIKEQMNKVQPQVEPEEKVEPQVEPEVEETKDIYEVQEDEE